LIFTGVGFLLAGLSAAVGAGGQGAGDTATPQPPPCAAPEFRQFAFWVGEWDARWEGGEGSNSITSILDGCVILESFDSRGPAQGGLRGMSVSAYNPALGKWQQTWVDNQGGYLDFAGEFKDGKMVLSRQASLGGKEFLQRMVWRDFKPDSFVWDWERSDDGGKTWLLRWQIRYTRKK
jgi:hypothetical protein